jgi:hypothetical protein
MILIMITILAGAAEFSAAVPVLATAPASLIGVAAALLIASTNGICCDPRPSR